MLKRTMSALAGALLLASSAQAATLTASGAVSVNRGNGFQPVSGTVTVNPGDRVLVGNGGSASIAYDATCVTSVTPNRLAIVRAEAPCRAGVTEPAAVGNTGLIVGGALLAGGIAAAVIVSNSKSNGASP